MHRREELPTEAFMAIFALRANRPHWQRRFSGSSAFGLRIIKIAMIAGLVVALPCRSWADGPGGWAPDDSGYSGPRYFDGGADLRRQLLGTPPNAYDPAAIASYRRYNDFNPYYSAYGSISYWGIGGYGWSIHGIGFGFRFGPGNIWSYGGGIWNGW